MPDIESNLDPKGLEAAVDLWDAATNAVCQTMQERGMCNCPDGDCLAAKIEISATDLANFKRAALATVNAEPVDFANGPVMAQLSYGQFLLWIADRMVHVHGEKPNYDYILRLREIASWLAAPQASAPVAVRHEELSRYIDKCRELARNGEYSWWSRLAEILEATTAQGGEAVQDTWFADRKLPIMAMSGDVESNRVLKLHFRRPVIDDDRKSLCDALNVYHASLATPAPSERVVEADLPWCGLKVAFGITDDDALWKARDSGALHLPDGWELNETDASGARVVAVFCVKRVPTIEDGEAVLAALKAQEGGR